MERRLMKTVVATAMAGLFSSSLCLAASADFVVQKVDVVGLKRISQSSIQDDIPIHKGEYLTTDKSNQIIEDLFKSGYFDNVELKRQDNTLVIQVQERPTIAKVTFSGNKEIKSKMLKKALLGVGIQTGDMFSRTLLQQLKQSLLQAYYARGKYSVEIKTQVVPLSRNRVDIHIHIAEGIFATISRINIVGNHAFSQSTLQDQLSISTPSLWSFFTGSAKYNQHNMAKSLDALQSYYMDRGYINFHINSTQVSLDPTLRYVYLTINISEGGKYHFKGVKLAGHLILPEQKLQKLIQVEPGAVFSRKKVLDTAKAITNALGNEGYAFAHVNPVPTIDKKTKTVSMTFYVTPGKRVYVRHINFIGNTVTNDQTLRQQMRFVEGSLYNRKKVDDSKIRVTRAYPFIESITEQNNPVPGSTDLVDVNYHVKERSANSFTASIGYSQLDKVIFGVGFNMPNLFGTGNVFDINTQLSKPYQSINFTYTQPYFTMSGISQSINFYYTRIDNAYRSIASYSTNSVGMNLNYGVPLSDTNTFNFGIGVDHTELENPSGIESLTVYDFTKKHGSSYNTYTLNVGLSHNSTNRAFFPTSGSKASISAKLAGPGSTLTWGQIFTSASMFYPVTNSITFSLGGNADVGKGYGKTKELPFYKNFFGGGWGSVRGYSQGTLGPLDTNCPAGSGICSQSDRTPGEPIGGNLAVNASANLYFPVPFTTQSKNIRWGMFADAGNVYATYRDNTFYHDYTEPRFPNLGNLRYSVGVSLEWWIPGIGPLAFSLAKPLNRKAGDDIQVFQFSLGGTF